MANELRLEGKNVVLTGATNGIGRATAFGLASAGADLVLACRNIDAAATVREVIIADTGNSSVELVKLDLASLASVRSAAAEIRSIKPHIDILINNAGLFNMRRGVTEDGFEMTMGVNHLGHFAFTLKLLPLLEQAAASESGSARIVNVASDGHLHGRIDFDNFFLERGYRCRSAWSE